MFNKNSLRNIKKYIINTQDVINSKYLIKLC